MPSINPTTMFLPGQGFGNYGQQLMDQGAPQRQQFLISNPHYDPTDPNSPQTIQDPSATGTPQATSFVGANGLRTTGVMNPFGLTQNHPEFGYYGATPPPAAPPPLAATPTPAPIGSGGGGEMAALAPDDRRPPDQQGFQGTYNPTTTLTTYATPNGQFSMDTSGNWFDQNGKPTEFDQSRSGEPPAGAPPVEDPRPPSGGQEGSPGGGVQTETRNPPPPAQAPPPNAGGAAPATGAPPAYGPDSYVGGVTSSYLDPVTGQMRYAPTNPYQFATPNTAQSIAQRYGGSTYGLNLQGPGMGFSQDQQQIRFPNGRSINAGLAAQTLGRREYGSGRPGSYGDFLVQRDINGTYDAAHDPWANTPNAPQQQAPPQTTAAVGAQQYQQQQSPQAAYQSQSFQNYPPPGYGHQQQAQQQQYQGYQPQQRNQAYQPPMRRAQPYGGQPGQGQPGYGGQLQPPTSQGQRYGSYGGSMGGNTRQPQQQPQQQPYTAGQSSGSYSPYGQGYLSSSGTPRQSRAGGYMQTGNNSF